MRVTFFLESILKVKQEMDESELFLPGCTVANAMEKISIFRKKIDGLDDEHRNVSQLQELTGSPITAFPELTDLKSCLEAVSEVSLLGFYTYLKIKIKMRHYLTLPYYVGISLTTAPHRLGYVHKPEMRRDRP